VDDGRTARTYSSGQGEVTIRDSWWDELGLGDGASGAFTVTPFFEPDRPAVEPWS
jgi:hypothetical protein